MIRLTKLNNSEFILNSDLIETIESTPDSVITLTNGKKYIVTQSIDEIIEKVFQYKSRILSFNVENYINKDVSK